MWAGQTLSAPAAALDAVGGSGPHESKIGATRNEIVQRTPAVIKKRAYPRRLRDDLIVLRIEVDEWALDDALIERGRLNPEESEDRDALAREGRAAGSVISLGPFSTRL